MSNRRISLTKACAVVLGALVALLTPSGANSANPESVVAQVTFVDPITLSENNALTWGLIDQVLNVETLIIATNSGLSGTGTGLILGGTRAAANLTVTATAAQAISIEVDTIVSGTGYGLTAFQCDYDGGGTTGACNGTTLDVASSAAGGTAVLLIGATLTGDNSAVPGAADGSFNVTVSYQ